jgi:hypothetical protein
MKFTNKQIATTKNEVLKTILVNMKPQIQKSIDLAIMQEQKATKRDVTEFGIECLESALLFDLYKNVVSYTRNDDKIKSFSSGISIKGNFELYGVVVRDGQEYSFRTEAIIANGMINIAHYRYITKTNLPNARNTQEADNMKAIIKNNNKQNRMIQEIERLEKIKSNSILDVERMSNFSREDWVNQLDDKLMTSNWDSFTQNQKDNGYHWSNEAMYNVWLNKVNEETIENQMQRLDWALERVERLDVSIIKENKKLDKFLATK